MINFLLAVSPEGLILEHYQHLAILWRQNTVGAHPLAELDIETSIIETGGQESLC